MIKEDDYLKLIASNCIDLSKKNGATDVSVQVTHSISESVNFRNQKLDESNRSDNLGIYITTFINKKKSSISSSNLSKNNLKILIERCIETTKNTPEDEYNSLPDKNLLAKSINDLNLYDKSHLSNDKKIQFLEEIEDSASNQHNINNTETDFTETKSNFILANSHGFINGYKTSNFSASCVAVSKKNGSMERDYEFSNKRHLLDLDNPEVIGIEASKKANQKLNPQKIKSEKIGVIFDKRISKGILSVLSGAINASAIARGTSFLKGKLNSEIFSKNINVFDDPNLNKGLGSRSFDGEGVKTDKLQLIENGVLKQYLIDTYYGKKLKINSNGRAGGTSNLFFENGKVSYQELLNSNKRNLYITETIGHGVNLVTGDYSVGATGFLVENGELKYPVSEVTIAGNFKDIFKNITLADDLEFKYSTNAPTVLVEGMVVAGK